MAHAPCQVEEIAHTAEVGLRLWAAEPGTLFACAGEAMFALMGLDVDESAAARTREVALASMDTESLLVDWLNELVYLFETTGEVYPQIEVVAWEPQRLVATVQGRRPAGAPRMQIKAVTYHELVVRREGEGWLAEVTFDI